MKFRSLSLQDKNLFNKYLGLKRHGLSVYSFANIYIWKSIFNIKWALVKDCLCVFFQDKIGCFLYLPPLGEDVQSRVIQEVFSALDALNKNKDCSRIENVEEGGVGFYKKSGYICQEKYPEYLCRRLDLAGLKGNAFKSKRASYNYFVSNYSYEYINYSPSDKRECLRLYDAWAKVRGNNNKDAVYKGMLLDGRASLKIFLDNYAGLSALGRVVKIKNRIKAFTFGFKLNSDTFVVLYEVTDLSVKGLAQFIFRKLCIELNKYKYINIMDDSGLENLKKVKLSYRPLKLIPAYIAKRDNA